jgi:uncharacterized protein YggE
MKYVSLLLGIIFTLPAMVQAEPEIKGTATELTHFLSEVPKSVIILGEAEVRVPAHRAVLSLRVITENKSLREAMRANLEIRSKLTEYLKGLGVPADRIQASKFSSTPKFGMFGDKAKSYRLENVMRISVQDENEFQAAAGAVDKWAEIQFDGVEFEYADKELQKQSAIAKACDNANDRKKVYEEKLGLKLTPARFSEGEVGQRNATVANYGVARGLYGSSSPTIPESAPAGPAAEDTVSSFGEIIYTAKVSVEYTVQTK